MSEVKNLQSTCTNCVRFFLNENWTREENIIFTRETQALCLEVDVNKLLKKQQQIKEMRIYTENLVKKANKKETKDWQKIFLKTITSIFKKDYPKESSKECENKLKSRSTPLRMGLSKTRRGKPLHPALHKSKLTQKKCEN